MEFDSKILAEKIKRDAPFPDVEKILENVLGDEIDWKEDKIKAFEYSRKYQVGEYFVTIRTSLIGKM